MAEEKTILQKIVERGHYKFVDSVPSWQEGVRISTESLVKTGYVEPDYYKQIVACIEKYGPYMVYDHEVAMPHTQENAVGALKTAVGFLRVKEVVDFGTDEDGEPKHAKLFFTLVANDPNEHLDNMASLMSVFTNYPLLDALQEANTPEDILRAEAENPPEEDDD
ncbi:MAG: PTS sugar transporter subunit IIA [Oscillibacter sp.]|nr:PTS sugar transporter subunit IIA [Oscillibacter sp.]